MPTIPPNRKFQPSESIMRIWFGTRKNPLSYDGIILPGLISTTRFGVDSWAMLAVIGLEFFGLYNLKSAGRFNVIIIIGLVVLDILFAFCSHFNQGKKKRIENLLLTTDDKVIQEQLRSKVTSINRWSRFFKACIITLALGKVIVFAGVSTKLNPSMTAFILFSYLFVAWLHIYCTGFFLWETFARIGMQYQSWRHISHIAYPATQYVSKPNFVELEGDNFNEFELNNHTLKRTDGKFIWKVDGILTDDDLKGFVNAQPENLRLVLVKHGHRFQVEDILKLTV